MPNPSVSVNTNTMSIRKKLTESLDFVVDTVVNQVGVNINTASPSLLAHVAGLNKTISENIVENMREEEWNVLSRAQN